MTGVFAAPEFRRQSARPLRAARLDRRCVLRHRHEPPAVQQISCRLHPAQCAGAGEDLRLLRRRARKPVSRAAGQRRRPCPPACGPCGGGLALRTDEHAAEHAAAGLPLLLHALAARAREMRARRALRPSRRTALTLFSRFTKFRHPGIRQRYCLSGRHDGIVLESDKAQIPARHQPQGAGRDEPRLDRGRERAEPGLHERAGADHGPVRAPGGACGRRWNIAGPRACCGGRFPRPASCRCRTRAFRRKCASRFRRRPADPISTPFSLLDSLPQQRAAAD